MEPFPEVISSLNQTPQHSTSSNLPLQEKISPALLSYAEKISRISSLSDWLLFLKNHTPKYLKSGEFILFYESQQFGLRRAYIRNKKFYEEVVQTPWNPPSSLSFNSLEINLYLAQEMGRSFSRVLAIPFNETILPLTRQENRTPVLFMELQPEKNQKALDFFKDKENILTLTLKRILLNIHRSRASYLWNHVFENGGEALAIIKEGRLIRANGHFKKLLSLYPQLLNFIKTKNIFQAGGRSYQFHYCSIFPEQKEADHSANIPSSSKNPSFPAHSSRTASPSSTKNTQNMGLIYCQDLTDYFQLKESLLQSEKMAAISKLGRNIAHELNNPLTGLRAMSQILIQNQNLKKFSADFQAVEAAAVRSQKIIENLLTFSRSRKTEKQICHINPIVRETLPLLKTLSNGIEIKLSLDNENALALYENPSLLQQMIFNLMTNACHAVQHLKGWQKPQIEVSTAKHSDQMLSLEIKDNGCGIPSDHLEKVFQPLWTTKKPGEGTGLGLGLVKRFVKSTGGDIHVSSELNKGSVFTVLLPLKT